MTPEKLLSSLSRDLDEKSADNIGGAIYLAVDREGQLRDRVGYKAIFNLVRQIRKVLSDNSPEGVQAVRFGVLSLLVRMPSSDGKSVQASARQVFEKLADHTFKIGDERMALSFSVSASQLDRRFADADEMVLALTRKVEELSAAGGNELAMVEPEISSHKAKASNGHMLGLLMDALTKDALQPEFQPMLPTNGGGSTRVFQVSPRLPASDGERIAPSEFWPIARRASLLPAIDRWVLVQARKALSQAGGEDDLHLFLEQSEALLTDESRRQWLMDLVDRHPYMQGRITIEIGIDDAMTHLRGLSGLSEAAGGLGVGLCLHGLDEHSRWDLIGESLPCDYVRMAPGFVARVSEDGALEQRFMDLSAPARARGARIIMPQINDSRTAATTWRCRPDYMQGSLIQPPSDQIPAEA